MRSELRPHFKAMEFPGVSNQAKPSKPKKATLPLTQDSFQSRSSKAPAKVPHFGQKIAEQMNKLFKFIP